MGGELERRELLVTHTRVAHCMHNRHSSYTLPVSVPRDLSVARKSRVMWEELRVQILCHGEYFAFERWRSSRQTLLNRQLYMWADTVLNKCHNSHRYRNLAPLFKPQLWEPTSTFYYSTSPALLCNERSLVCRRVPRISLSGSDERALHSDWGSDNWGNLFHPLYRVTHRVVLLFCWYQIKSCVLV